MAKWQIKRTVNGVPENVTSAVNIPVTINQGQWHKLTIKQQGTSLIAYLNGNQLGTATYNSSWGDSRRRFGIFFEVRDTNNEGGEPFEVFFDNVGVSDLP